MKLLTKEEYKLYAYNIVYLISCFCNDKIPKKESLNELDLACLYEVAKRHSITSIVAYSLENAEMFDEQFNKERAKSTRRTIYFNIERTALISELEKAKIWYMPLKGIIMQEYYPKNNMREMADNDILFDKSRVDDIKIIMQKLGFEMEHDDSGHDLVFYKKPVCNFEMHTELFGIGEEDFFNNYYSDVKDRFIKNSSSGFGYHFSNEDFYIFMIAHEYKHFHMGGTGLRSLLDTYIFIQKFGNILNWEYISSEFEKLGIAGYEKKSRELSLHLFSGMQLTPTEKELLDYYIYSGTYGTTQNAIDNMIGKMKPGKNRKWVYLLKRISVPFSKNNSYYKPYNARYPFFYKHKLLIPFLPIYRFLHALFFSRKRIMTEIIYLVKK